MQLRFFVCLLAVLLASACSPAPENPLAELLGSEGFVPATPNQQGELLYKKPLKDVTLWVSLPQGWGLAPGPVMMIKAAGAGGALNAATDKALTTHAEVGKLVDAASRGAYPPTAMAEVFKLAQEAAAQPPHNGALMTSPKNGYSLRVPHTKGHLRLVLVVRHKRP